MGCRIFFVRHGETKWNETFRLQGQTDIPLSATGVEQAWAISKRLESLQFAGIFSSHLTRAKETAAIIAKPHGLTVKELPDLQELNFGDWEGLTVEELKKNHTELAKTWWENPLGTRIPGGETLAELAERATRSTMNIIEKYPQEQVVVVAHGGTIRSVVGSMLGLDLNQYWRLRQDNASLTVVEFHGWDNGILMLYNDCSHLNQAFCY